MLVVRISRCYSAILADRMLNEKLMLLGKVSDRLRSHWSLVKIGCTLCILGSTVIVLNVPEERQVNSVEEITDEMFSNIRMLEFWLFVNSLHSAFQLYAIAVILSTIYLIYVVAPVHGRRNIFVYVTICSIVGSISVIGVKVCKTLRINLMALLLGAWNCFEVNIFGKQSAHILELLGLRSSCGSICHDSNELLEYGDFSCCLFRLIKIKALDTFNTALVTPIYYVIFTTATIVASALLFRGWTSNHACDPKVWKPTPYDGPSLNVQTTAAPTTSTLFFSADCTG